MSYVPNTDSDRKKMLEKIGVQSFLELIDSVPHSIRLKEKLSLPEPLSELELTRLLRDLAHKNKSSERLISFLGGGAYDHFVPGVVDHILSRSEYYTAYTPYQAEVSQGTLQTIYEFQSLMCQLTGMDVANASMYDGASACAEACILASSHTKRKRILIAGSLNPNYVKVIKTYSQGLDLRVEMIPYQDGIIRVEDLRKKLKSDIACVMIQNPNFFGLLENIEDIEPWVHLEGSLLIMAVDPISLGILRTPSEYNVDIAVGEGMALGNPLSYGGPGFGFFATKQNLIRRLPGRLVGKTTDSQGKRGFVLTLQTREQHIRREKATSNICTNQALCALAGTVYLSLLGGEGLKETASLCLQKSHYALNQIIQIDGFQKRFEAPFFKEFVIETPLPPKRIIKSLLKQNILAGLDLAQFAWPVRDRKLKNSLLVCVTEKRTKAEIDFFVEQLKKLV